jgi:ATP synthase protein I
MTNLADRVPVAMAHSGPETPPRPAYGDPWQAFGYLVAGVLFYGFLGWLADRWLDTRFLVVVGVFLGVALGIYMTFGRFGRINDQTDEQSKDPQE